VPTGTANIASVRAAFNRLGANTTPAMTPGDVTGAGYLVVPGVGSFGAAMATVDSMGMRGALVERLEKGLPTLAVCVGMQLLCQESTESVGRKGLGVVPAPIDRFDGDVRVPQLGWNEVDAHPQSRYLKSGWAYFANSYRLADPPDEWVASTAWHGSRFVAALERGSVLALQFHPELSGAWGQAIIERWLMS
jgi:imidazole glycerol-phosphate synthase subunit HisH